jgi:predicted type IV restriction endonuclease
LTKALSISNFVLHITNFSKTDVTSSEANTKKRLIEPLLEILGWDLLSNEVRLEYPVKIGSRSTYVDYALMLEDKPVVLVEAKSFNDLLSENYSSQIISYGKVEDVQWVALTNGRRLKVFDTKAGKTEKDCLVVDINLETLPQQVNKLKLLSRESILTGDIEKTARRLALTRTAIHSLKQSQHELLEAFKNILIKITGPELENRIQSVSSQLAKQTVKLFEEKVEVPPSYPTRVERLISEVQSVYRKDLSKKADGEVVLCPSRVEGIDFLKKYNAWGFINISKYRRPDYFALYVGRPESSVLYFSEIESITKPLESKEELIKILEEDMGTFETGKRVIHLKKDTLVAFKDPLPLKNKRMAPRALRYMTLKKLIQTNYVEEL